MANIRINKPETNNPDTTLDTLETNTLCQQCTSASNRSKEFLLLSLSLYLYLFSISVVLSGRRRRQQHHRCCSNVRFRFRLRLLFWFSYHVFQLLLYEESDYASCIKYHLVIQNDVWLRRSSWCLIRNALRSRFLISPLALSARSFCPMRGPIVLFWIDDLRRIESLA